MTYTITIINAEQKEALAARYMQKARYEIKAEIYGCCIKLLTDNHSFMDTWQENFYSMSQNVRSHGRLFVFSDPGYPRYSV